MKIALDTSPLDKHSMHAVRGSGFYIRHLVDSFKSYEKQYDFIYSTNKEELQKADLIHYPYFEPFFLTLPIKKTLPTVVTVHDLTPLVFPHYFPSGIKGNLKWQMQKHSLKKMDAIITDSFSSKKDIIRFTGIPEERVHVIYLAAGEEFRRMSNVPTSLKLRGASKFQMSNFKKKYNLPERFALYVGDATWNKNLPRLVRAIQKEKIPLVMVGKALSKENVDATNPWNTDLVTVREMIKHDPNIILPGFLPQEDLVLLYTIADVFVMPSLYEGFGLPILEAMSSGAPVVTSREGSIPEVAGDAAHYCNASDEGDIGKKVYEVFSDKTLQNVLKEKGLKQAERFSWKKTAEQTIDVYTNVLRAHHER